MNRQVNNEGIPETISNFVHCVGGFMLRHPDKLGVKVDIGSDDIVTVTIKPHSNADTGQFIGREAKLLIAWRMLLNHLCCRLGHRLHLAPIRQPNRPLASDNRNSEPISDLVKNMCDYLFDLQTSIELLDDTFFIELDADEKFHEKPKELEESFSRIVNAAARASTANRRMYVNLSKPLNKTNTHESNATRGPRHHVAR